MAKNETTATEIAPAKLADEAAAAKFELDPHLINLMSARSFAGAPSGRPIRSLLLESWPRMVSS